MAEETNDTTSIPAPDAAIIEPVILDSKPLTSFWARISSKVWWHNTKNAMLAFAPHCVFAAGLWTLAGTVVISGVWQYSLRMQGGVLSLESILVAGGILLASLVALFVLMMWSLGIWLIKATAFVRSFAQLPMSSELVSKATIVETQKKALAESSTHKAFLAKYWLLISLFLAPAMACLGLTFIVRAIPCVTAQGLSPYVLDSFTESALNVLICILSVIVTEVSVVSLVVSANTTLKPLEAAKQAVILSVKNFGPATLLTAGVMVANVVVSSPQVLLKLNNANALFAVQTDVTKMLVENLWQGIISVVLWPVSSAPMCELLRGKVK